MTTSSKVISILTVLVLIGIGVYGYVKFFFVYSTGTNEGDINYFQSEGFIFKTYEGKMIQTGYNSHNNKATIQSNEFLFSVEDKEVAEQIETNSSRQVKLHWRRYLGTLPWRGKSQFVVDSVMAVKSNKQAEDPFPEIPQP